MSDRKPLLFVQYGNFLFKYRNTLFPVILIPLLLILKPAPVHEGSFWSVWSDLIGWCIAILGQLIRVAVIGLVYIVRGGRNHKVYADDLVTDGIFSHCRNPLYVGNLLILFGLFIIHNNPWVYLLGIPFFLTSYMAIVAAEEFFLGNKFGEDYQRYCRSTNRWLPRLKGLSSTFRSLKFHWKRVVAKDYSSFSYWVLAAILIMGEEWYYYREAYSGDFWLTVLIVALFMDVLIFYISRKFKKAGRLAG